MKTFSLLITLIIWATTLITSIAFAKEPMVRFSIDKEVYNQMSEDQKSGLAQKTSELSYFVEEKIRSIIPLTLNDKIQDLKIKISLTNTSGRDGLFTPHENGGEDIISIKLIQLYSNGIKALLAHEIYHAIHFHINPNETAWVREGMAQLFEYIVTEEMNGLNLAAAIKNPMTPLLGSYDTNESNPAQYGHDQLYFQYLYSHCGKNNFFWSLTKGQPEEGLKGSFLIDATLDKLNLTNKECKNFTDSAISFEVAKSHNQMQFTKLSELTRYIVTSGDISPLFAKVTNESSLKNTITNMPSLSSFKLPLNEYLLFKGKCSNCSIFYANRTYPYSVSEEMPKSSKNIDVILVKLRQY